MQEGTEPIENVIQRITRTYDPSNEELIAGRDEEEIRQLEVVAHALKGIRDNPDIVKTELIQIRDFLQAIIEHKYGPGETPEKDRTMVLAPDLKPTFRLSIEDDSEEAPPRAEKKSYVKVRTKDPRVAPLLETYGFKAFAEERLNLIYGRDPNNEALANAIARIALSIEEEENNVTIGQEAEQAPEKPAETSKSEQETEKSPDKPVILTEAEIDKKIRDAVERTVGVTKQDLADLLKTITGEAEPEGPPPKESPYIEDYTNKGARIRRTKEGVSLAYLGQTYVYYYGKLSSKDLPKIKDTESPFAPMSEELAESLMDAISTIKSEEERALKYLRATQEGFISRLKLTWEENKSEIHRMHPIQYKYWKDNFIKVLQGQVNDPSGPTQKIPTHDDIAKAKRWHFWPPVRKDSYGSEYADIPNRPKEPENY